MRSFNKLANLHRVFFKRAQGPMQPQTSRAGGIGGDVTPPWRSPNASERLAQQPPPRSAYSILSNPTAADRMRDAPNPLSPEFRTGPREGGRWSNEQKAILDPAGQHPFNLSHNRPTAQPGPDTVRNVQMP
jgi:hypothetical protein